MKRRSLLIVVALLCMASLMAAMAFTTATSTSNASFNIVNANEALLALIPGDHNAAWIDDDSNVAQRLEIDWDKGNGKVDFGIQPYSTYEWDDLFAVKNNSENYVHVTIALDNSYTGSVSVTFNEVWVAARRNNGTTLEFNLAPGGVEYIDTVITSGEGEAMDVGQETFNMTVGAVKIATPEE